MQIYNPYTLTDTRYPIVTGWFGLLKAPSLPDILKLLEQSTYFKAHYSKVQFTDCRYKVVQNKEVTSATIVLELTLTNGGALYLAGCVLSSVHHNCGTLHLSGFNSEFKKCGIGTILLNDVLNWAIGCGYTMIHGNTAGTAQNTVALPFFKKHGFLQMGKSYVNQRSGNVNVWIQKLIVPCSPQNYVDEDQDDDWDDDHFNEEDN